MPLLHTGNINIDPELGGNYTASDVLFSPIMLGEARPIDTEGFGLEGFATDFHRNFVASVDKIGLTWGIISAPEIMLMVFEGNPQSFGAVNEPCAISYDDLRGRVATILIDTTRYITLNTSQFLDITGEGIGIIQVHRDSPLYLAGVINDNYAGDLAGQLHIQIDLSFGGERGSL